MKHQCYLTCDNSVLLCWLDTTGIKKGYEILLKDIPNRWWKVRHIYSTPLDDTDLHKSWKVGGLR